MVFSLLKKHDHWVKDVLGLLLLFTLFYLLWLGSYPLFTPDEGRYSEVAREMVATHDYLTPRLNGVPFLDKPALYYWLQALAIHLVGINEWALRLFPALFGVLGAIVTYLAGRWLFDRRTGLLSAVILATTPLYFAGAHYANLDLEVAVLISCSLLFFITGVMRSSPSRIYFFIAAYSMAGLAFLTKGMIGIAFPVMIAGAWILSLRRFSLLKQVYLPTGIAIILLINLPWYVLVQNANPDFLHYFFLTQQVTRFLSATEFNNKTPFWFYAPIIMTGFFPWTCFLVQSIRDYVRNILRKQNRYQVELFLLLWVAIVFVFFSIPRSKTIGHIFPILPGLALLVGSYLSRHFENAQQQGIRRGIYSVAVLGSLLAVIGFSLLHARFMHMPQGFVFYFSAIASLILVGSLASLALINQKTLAPLFALCACSSVILLLVLTAGAGQLNPHSAKFLSAELHTIIGPQDEIVNYYKYYYDVPLYLNRNVIVVNNWNSPSIPTHDNWARELWVGMQMQPHHPLLIDDALFWQHYESDRRVFVFLNKNYFDQFKLRANSYFYLGSDGDTLLLSNKPTLLALRIQQSSPY